MTESLHPAAAHHLPPFVTAPGETDVLFVAMAIFVLLAVIGIGIFYFKLHALPEQMAHRGQKVQFEVVAVLALLALFTHNHVFWIAGLLLAFVPLPDFTTPLKSIARSLDRMAGGAEPVVPAPPPAQEEPAPAGDQPIEQPPSDGSLSHVGAFPLLDADHPAGLPLSPLRAGQAARTRDHAVLGLVRAALGDHAVPDPDREPDHDDLLLSSLDQGRHLGVPDRDHHAGDQRSGRGDLRRASTSG